jgi:hypothetical protein
VGAARVVNFWKMPPKHALALGKQKILRFWSFAAQRGRAGLTGPLSLFGALPRRFHGRHARARISFT